MDERKASSRAETSKARRFEDTFSEHLDAAYDLAYWLARDRATAEDVAQEACLRAYRFLDGFRGGNGRAWLLAIVRNTYYSWLEKNHAQAVNVPFDEEMVDAEGNGMAAAGGEGASIERWLQSEDSRRLVNRALGQLPPEFREVIVLRELEDMSYKEISQVTNAPIGTVMSRLSRARKLLLARVKQAGGEL